MNWYEKLNEYFPIEEMKSKKHMDILLHEKSDVYYKDEGPNHVLMYAEFKNFIFIDYVWVSEASRGQGIGKQLIQKLQRKNISILLEVEPIDEENKDSEKRLGFYKKLGFKHAESIDYNRKSLATNEENVLEILYWSPNEAEEDMIFKQMKKMYEDIHTYKDKELYGESYQDVDEVLSFNEDQDTNDLLDIDSTQKSND